MNDRWTDGVGCRLAALLLCAMFAPGCQDPLRAGAPQPDLASMRTVTSNDGTHVIAWRVISEPLPLNEPFDLEVMVLDKANGGSLRRDVDLVVDAAMPEHGHGMNVMPTVSRVEGGKFMVRGLRFHMPGRWELYFDVTRGRVTERAQVEIHLE